jgi:hypothetical protein
MVKIPPFIKNVAPLPNNAALFVKVLLLISYMLHSSLLITPTSPCNAELLEKLFSSKII